ncbi:MAG: hypothetical protein IT434_09675 [Phycisphaerales bacterium]|jgi:hypothetical protein|nr:hypothetical protein [Phycisphaerales bacterium]
MKHDRLFIGVLLLLALGGRATAQSAEPPKQREIERAAGTPVLPTSSQSSQPATPQPAASAPASWRGDGVLTEEILARLTLISPGDPESLLRAGEDFAAMGSPLSVRVARRILSGAIEVDRARGGGRVAAGACLLLAELSTSEPDRRWFAALARAMEAGAVGRSWLRPGDAGYNAEAAYNAACVVGLVRAGDGLAARQLMNEPGVRQVLLDHERLLSTIGEPGGLAYLEREAGKWPCPECRNDRVVRTVVDRQAQYKLCPTCNGNPGPSLGDDALILQLRLEARLLHGVQRSWAAQLAADHGLPLDDPDPEELSKVLGFDSRAFVFKDGGWYRVDGSQPGPVSPFAPKPAEGGAPPGDTKPETPVNSPEETASG